LKNKKLYVLLKKDNKAPLRVMPGEFPALTFYNMLERLGLDQTTEES
jgi:hypothetical protein